MTQAGELTMQVDAPIAASRAFVRSFNVLLKYARLYGQDHSRASAQFDIAWTELQQAIELGGQAGVLLGAAGSQLLLDGVPLETTPAERSFAEFLTAAGVASVYFGRRLTREELAKFVRIFLSAGTKAAGLSDRLQAALGEGGLSGIRVNEIRFVAEDSGYSEARVAAQLTAKTLGVNEEQVKDWFRSPEKLIELIAAAEGAAHGGTPSAGSGTGEGVPSGPDASGGTGTGLPGRSAAGTAGGVYLPGGMIGTGNVRELTEGQILGLLRVLAQFGEAAQGRSASMEVRIWQEKFGSLPQAAQMTLRQALAGVAAASPNAKVDEVTLMRLAEDLAIRFALDRFQRGEVRVNAVRQLLEKMSSEVETLRKIVKAREEKLSNAGITVESSADILDRQFWAGVPDSAKRRVLLSPEAWCIPPRNVQQFVEELMKRGESDAAGDILLRYASCVRNKDPEARRKAAIGLSQLAELYSRAASIRFQKAMLEIGEQMAEESEPELQTLLSAAFVRLSQEAVRRRYYLAMQQALVSLAKLEERRPNWVQGLRPRIGVEARLPEFLEEAANAEAVPEGLVAVLQRLPRVAGEHLSIRLGRSVRCTERERLVELAKMLGPACVDRLREILQKEPLAKAMSVVGLLSRLEPATLQKLLPPRLAEGGRSIHDAVIRQLATAGAPERGSLLAGILEQLDASVVSLAIDEVGMAGDSRTAPLLLRLAEGELPNLTSDYLRVKAIEALGRLRAPDTAERLQHFLEARKTLGWAYPEEIRVAAAQALAKLAPDWLHEFLPKSDLDPNVLELAPLDPRPERDFARHRRYRRIRLSRAVPAVISSQRGKGSSTIDVLSLEGGLLSGDFQLTVGTEANLKIPAGLRAINLHAIVRFVRSHQCGFEMVGMALEDRARLRRLLLALSTAVPAAQ